MKVIWITGLSGSGKSTLAREVVNNLREKGKPVILLDGDELGGVFGAENQNDKNHTYEGRLALSKQYSHLCKLISSQGVMVVIATISLFHGIHVWNRKNLSDYYEVYLKVPIEELRKRDPKGIYKSFDEGKLKNVAGIDLKIDEPKNPDWLIDFNFEQSTTKIAKELLTRINLI